MSGTPSAARTPPLAHVIAAATVVVAEVLHGATPESALAALDEAVRPAATDLALSTLRDFGRGDFLLDRLLARPLQADSAATARRLRALLLCALYRLETRPEAAHTIVDQAVAATRKVVGARPVALVNAVLRNFQRQRRVLLVAADADSVARWRHPDWWLKRLAADHPDAWREIAEAGNTHPPMSLRLNNRRPAIATVRSEGGPAGGGGAEQRPAAVARPWALDEPPPDGGGRTAHGMRRGDDIGEIGNRRPATTGVSPSLAALPHHVLPWGAWRLETPMPVARLPGFAEGLVSVQDAGAQLAALLLDPPSGARVLDACSAPGGKTAHLLERADIDLLALEVDSDRAERVRSNLARLGLAAEVRVADARAVDAWWDGRPFTHILADVPCSASGVVRRHPDAKWLRRAADIQAFADMQRQILDALWQTLAPDGKMLYATCSMFAQENSQQVAAFLARHADAAREPFQPPGSPTIATELQLLPTADHDGFYYALLAKRP